MQQSNRFETSFSRQLRVLPSVKSPASRRQRSSTNLSPSKRWETFLDDKGIQDYVGIPLKRMAATLDNWNRQSQLAIAFSTWRERLIIGNINYNNRRSTSTKSYNSVYSSYSSTEAKQLQQELVMPSPFSDRSGSYEADDFLDESNIEDEGTASGFQSPQFAYEAALYNASDGLPMELEDAMFSAWELQQPKSNNISSSIPSVAAADKKLGLMEENRRTEMQSLMSASRPNQQYQIVKESQYMQQESDDLSVGFELPP